MTVKNELPDRWKYKKWESPRNPVNAGQGFFGWPPQKGAAKDTPFKAFEYPGGKKDMKLEYVDKCSYRNAKRPDKVAFQVRPSLLLPILVDTPINITPVCFSQKMRLVVMSSVRCFEQSNIVKL